MLYMGAAREVVVPGAAAACMGWWRMVEAEAWRGHQAADRTTTTHYTRRGASMGVLVVVVVVVVLVGRMGKAMHPWALRRCCTASACWGCRWWWSCVY